MRRIALIGGGISSTGALTALRTALSNDGDSQIAVDQYSAPIAGSQIHSKFNIYDMPSSSANGYLSRWGAVLAMVPIGKEEYREMVELFCSGSVRAALLQRISQTSGLVDNDIVPYYCADRNSINLRINDMKKKLIEKGLLNNRSDQVIRLSQAQSKWRIELDSGRVDEVYDAVVLSAGAISTPNLLMSSELIERQSELPLKDHVLIFGGCEALQGDYVLHPAQRSLQYVASLKTQLGYMHDVALTKSIGFDAQDMASLYCLVAGRRLFEVICGNWIEVLRKLGAAMANSGWSIRKGRHIRVSVGDENYCSANLMLDSDVPKIAWASRSSSIAVSAFHFHGSLEHHAGVDELKVERLYIGDLSTTSSVRDQNTGTFSFQTGYRAMAEALRDMVQSGA